MGTGVPAPNFFAPNRGDGEDPTAAEEGTDGTEQGAGKLPKKFLKKVFKVAKRLPL